MRKQLAAQAMDDADFIEALEFDHEMYLAGMMACKAGESHFDGNGENFDKGYSDQYTIEQMMSARKSN